MTYVKLGKGGTLKIPYGIEEEPDKILLVPKEKNDDLIRTEFRLLEYLKLKGAPVVNVYECIMFKDRLALKEEKLSNTVIYKPHDRNSIKKMLENTVNDKTLETIKQLFTVTETESMLIEDLQFIIDEKGITIIDPDNIIILLPNKTFMDMKTHQIINRQYGRKEYEFKTQQDNLKMIINKLKF